MRFRQLVMMIAAVSVATEPVLAAPAVAPLPKPAAVEIVADESYVPQDQDERGLWMEMEKVERELKISPLVMRDPALNAYIKSVLCKTIGQARCAPVRLYIIRTSEFNATMAPNGMLEVYSGLLLRTRNEAQLAAVLGHEYTHYAQRHSLKLFRDVRSKSASLMWLQMVVGGLLASLMILPSIFKHSRDMEQDADVGGLAFMSKAGYDTREAARIWEQLREEMDATAASRKVKSRKDKDHGMFEDHPPSSERVKYLTEMAAKDPGTPGATGQEAYAANMAPDWGDFADDQIKQNDFGASDYLITSLGKQGWTDWLYFARGELYRRHAAEGDLEKAAGFYGEGIAASPGLPDLWRGRGLVLLKLGRADEGKADLREYLKRAPDASDKAMIAMMAGG
ncbi:MAG: tetratricopeptide repeat protein [Novosphingobium sp.]